jgi:hypothetical protein
MSRSPYTEPAERYGSLAGYSDYRRAKRGLSFEEQMDGLRRRLGIDRGERYSQAGPSQRLPARWRAQPAEDE